ncbi:DBH-like monooxygenase protein 1 [Penaeus chinensis]|uniref:DBH-like monooxygenase protein 1 n=1 Tax=Penaeus chinensis TaxID=139456 RepID=UPI001FB5CB20|nr:DBH-like monooxygenase protein 1 [Penaeus chinensis]
MGTTITFSVVGVVYSLIAGVTSLPGGPLPPMAFRHFAVLDQRGDFHLLWTPGEQDVVFEIQVATRGYVGLGFSPNGGMKGADIVLGWVDAQGDVHTHDRYATGMMIPVIDDSQDVEILGGYENETHTVLRFARPWNTCDKEHDFQLTKTCMSLVLDYIFDRNTRISCIVDSSGLRLFLTEDLREFEAGVLILGHMVSPSHIIPPGKEWRTVGHCDGRCVEQALPPEGVKVFRGLLHAHLLGTDITLRQIREGRELPVVFKDMNYDFNYQQGRILKEEMTILPGDSFITECGYDARHKQTPTFGGESTQEEMCIAFLTYYPRTDFTFCLSGSDLPSIYTSFGIQEVYGELDMGKSSRVNGNALLEKMIEKKEKNKKETAIEVDYAKIYKGVVAKAPQDLQNVSLYDLILDPKTWQDEKLLARLQEQTAFGPHTMFCGMRGNKVFDGYPRSYKYPDFLAIKLLDEECDANHGAEAYVPVTSEDEGRKQDEDVNADVGEVEEEAAGGSGASEASFLVLAVALGFVGLWRP